MSRFRLAFRLFWLTFIFWAEHLVFRRAVSDCRWPGNSGAAAEWTHVLVVADPQILDLQSYPDRSWVLRHISKLMTDLNMRRSWAAARRLRPDAVVFLGDMMDRGRADMPDKEYEAYYSRFRSMFHTGTVPTYFLPGNHDVGLGDAVWFSSSATSRYTSRFGPLAQTISLANHTLVLVNGPGLVDEDVARTYSRMPVDAWTWPHAGAFDFVQTTSSSLDTATPVVLFTHVPLARPADADCGPLRERGTIRAGRGEGYENTLGQEVSAAVRRLLSPAIVFSGDDHDYCDYIHGADGAAQSVREVTVKSFSMAMGVKHPGFQLLSLRPSPSALRTAPCLLPDQLGLYLRFYLPLVLLSVCVVLADQLRRAGGGACEDCMDGLELDEPRGRLPGPAAAKWSHAARRRRAAFCARWWREVCAVAWPPLLLWAAMAAASFW